jgi:hypothetical protein
MPQELPAEEARLAPSLSRMGFDRVLYSVYYEMRSPTVYGKKICIADFHMLLYDVFDILSMILLKWIKHGVCYTKIYPRKETVKIIP